MMGVWLFMCVWGGWRDEGWRATNGRNWGFSRDSRDPKGRSGYRLLKPESPHEKCGWLLWMGTLESPEPVGKRSGGIALGWQTWDLELWRVGNADRPMAMGMCRSH